MEHELYLSDVLIWKENKKAKNVLRHPRSHVMFPGTSSAERCRDRGAARPGWDCMQGAVAGWGWGVVPGWPVAAGSEESGGAVASGCPGK